jgi:SH3 domain protein
MIQKKVTFALAIISLSSTAFAANYVSNDLFTYTHSGPGSKYKILGTVDAGQKITVLNRNDGYTQIRDSKGRTVWINSKYVSNEPGLKEQLETLKVQYAKLDEKLQTFEDKANENKASLEENLNSNIQQVQELKKTNASLSNELKKVQEENDSLSNLLDNEKNELLMKWFSYGGMVAGIGLILGLILPSIMPSKKRNSRF